MEFKRRVIITLLIFLLGSSSIMYAQTITGIVRDKNKESLPGVSVIVSGTTIGTSTDIDGIYSINTKGGQKLEFSMIGYATQTVTVNETQTAIDISLQDDALKIDEAVVTALGMKREKKALGYAVQEIKGEALLTNAVNPISGLQGKIAGAQIENSDGGMFGSMKIQLRGSSTLKGNNQPIYVVDGVVLDNAPAKVGSADYEQNATDFGNELKNLNPDDFESITVLKGAAATALYGSRGMKGAIVITTKNSKKNQALGINVSQTFGVDYVFKQPRMQNVYGPGEPSGWVEYGKKNQNGEWQRWDNQHQLPLTQYNGVEMPELYRAEASNERASYGPNFDGRDIVDYDNKLTKYNAQNNNFKEMYDPGFNTNTNVSIQGGTDKTTFFSSLSYKYAEGTLPNNSFERLSFLAKASHQITDKVNLAASMSFANATPKNPQPNIGHYFVSIDPKDNLPRTYDPSYYKTRYLGDAHNGLAQPNIDQYGKVPGRELWFGLYQDERKQKETNVRPSLELNVAFTDWLKWKTEANFNYYFIRKEEKIAGRGYALEGGHYLVGQYLKEQTNFASTLMANKNLGDWDFGGFLRGEFYNNYVQNTEIKTEGGLTIPGQYFIQNSKQAPKYSETGKPGSKRIMSIASQFTVSWRNQVFVDVTARNDWSSTLVYANKSGNYSYFYPSLSGSWLLNESFTMPKWVNLAKIRSSIAQVGNDTDPYSVNVGYNLNSTQFGDNWVYGLRSPYQAVEPNIRPERKNAWEVGLDWRFFQSRLNLDVTYYKDNVTDQIMSIDVPEVSGIKQQLINAGNIQNQGVEIVLSTVPYRSKDWEVTADFTYSKNTNKIISMHQNVADFVLLEGDPSGGAVHVASVAKQGGDYGMLISTINAKRDPKTGKEVLKWNSGDRYAYTARSETIEEIGSLVPDFLGSFAAGLRYKNLSLRVALDARFGGYVASYGSRYGAAFGFTERSLPYSAPEYGGMTWKSKYDGLTYTDGVIPDGVFEDGTKIISGGQSIDVSGRSYQEVYDQGLVEPTHASMYHYRRNSWSRGIVNDNWLNELSYIALREISVRYQMPSSIANKIGAKSMNLILTGRNLGYLYNTMPSGENPESVRGTSSGQFILRSFSAFTANYLFTINMGF